MQKYVYLISIFIEKIVIVSFSPYILECLEYLIEPYLMIFSYYNTQMTLKIMSSSETNGNIESDTVQC